MSESSNINKVAILLQNPESPSALVIRTAVECSGFVAEGYSSLQAYMRSARKQEHAALVFDGDFGSDNARSLVNWRSSWLDQSIAILAFGPDCAISAAEHLNQGVDDYVRLPIQGIEFIARLKAALRRRYEIVKSTNTELGGCRLDTDMRSLVSISHRVRLTDKELGIARILFDNAGQPVSRERLAKDVWGTDPELNKRSIEQHIYQLKRKLKQCVAEAVTLRATYGGGYRLIDSSKSKD